MLLLLAAMVVTLKAAAQGEQGLQAAEATIKGYFPYAVNLMYAIGALVGIVGAVKVYNKWSAGDQDTSKVASSWFGACIFLVVVATILKAFYKV
ncbi:DUF4134 domain-containing protein [Chitinophaga silvisoli]|uniref:DUF4134 domain-containing protein n=2 Tax=Chitinophaga silvisoli TaxID=2291814 RepID=A0A3E1P2K5_9BACT|nr:DUF4134 domain-containing protein [Chitinophaga silvisoli]RFM34433.1 DUF4134 domain-containing protein [Chitinophaga silvisoli]